jgi:hypothetical protein
MTINLNKDYFNQKTQGETFAQLFGNLVGISGQLGELEGTLKTYSAIQLSLGLTFTPTQLDKLGAQFKPIETDLKTVSDIYNKTKWEGKFAQISGTLQKQIADLEGRKEKVFKVLSPESVVEKTETLVIETPKQELILNTSNKVADFVAPDFTANEYKSEINIHVEPQPTDTSISDIEQAENDARLIGWGEQPQIIVHFECLKNEQLKYRLIIPGFRNFYDNYFYDPIQDKIKQNLYTIDLMDFQRRDKQEAFVTGTVEFQLKNNDNTAMSDGIGEAIKKSRPIMGGRIYNISPQFNRPENANSKTDNREPTSDFSPKVEQIQTIQDNEYSSNDYKNVVVVHFTPRIDENAWVPKLLDHLYIKGTGPMMNNWELPIQLEYLGESKYVFQYNGTYEDFEFKIVKNNEHWSVGDSNYRVEANGTTEITPTF